MYPDFIKDTAANLLACCRERRVVVSTAESCTGGLVAGALTEIAGSSDVVDGGFVTYSNAAKHRELGVDNALIAQHGAVSHLVAQAMAEGARRRSGAGLAIACTGIAGPGGGTAEKPVGLVYVAVASGWRETQVQEWRFSGGRAEIRLATVQACLQLARTVTETKSP